MSPVPNFELRSGVVHVVVVIVVVVDDGVTRSDRDDDGDG